MHLSVSLRAICCLKLAQGSWPTFQGLIEMSLPAVKYTPSYLLNRKRVCWIETKTVVAVLNHMVWQNHQLHQATSVHSQGGRGFALQCQLGICTKSHTSVCMLISHERHPFLCVCLPQINDVISVSQFITHSLCLHTNRGSMLAARCCKQLHSLQCEAP